MIRVYAACLESPMLQNGRYWRQAGSVSQGIRRRKAVPPAARTSNRDEVHAMQSAESDNDPMKRARVVVAHELADSRREVKSARRGWGSPISTEQEKKRTTGGKGSPRRNEGEWKKAKSNGKGRRVELTIEYGLLGEDECQWRAIQDGHKQIIANKRREDDQGKSWCAGLKTQNWASWK